MRVCEWGAPITRCARMTTMNRSSKRVFHDHVPPCVRARSLIYLPGYFLLPAPSCVGKLCVCSYVHANGPAELGACVGAAATDIIRFEQTWVC